MMNDKLKRALAAAAALAVLAGGGAAIALASGSGGAASTAPGASAEPAESDEGAVDDEASGRDDGEGTPVTGGALDRASAVALERVGGGQVTGTEVGDEEGAYEIEVTRDDGSQVDVHLDADFNVLDAEDDG
jgi:uncharacterized membrane protein YkoI